jgi:hypothetical protein
MEQHDECQDAAIAQTLAEEEITLATASSIELARRLAERPAIVYQEIAFEQGRQNSIEAAQEPALDPPKETPPPPHCLLCNRAERLSEIEDVGHLCFTCLEHNSGAELEGFTLG